MGVIKLNQKNDKGQELYQYVIIGDKATGHKKQYGDVGTLSDLNHKYLSEGSQRSYKAERKPKHLVTRNNKANCKALRVQVIDHSNSTKDFKTRKRLNKATKKTEDVQVPIQEPMTKTKTQKVPTAVKRLNTKSNKKRVVKDRLKLHEVKTSKVVRHEATSSVARKTNHALHLDRIETQKSKWHEKNPRYKRKAV